VEDCSDAGSPALSTVYLHPRDVIALRHLDVIVILITFVEQQKQYSYIIVKES